VIDRDLKRSLGQMVKGVHVVGAAHDGLVRAYTSHWICQVSFTEPIVMASVSPKHDTHPLITASGRFSVSILGGDQVEAAQYFGYPGHRMRYVVDEHLRIEDGLPVVVGAVAWMVCEVERSEVGVYDHDLFFARVTRAGTGRLEEPPLLYSARHGWRVTGPRAREAGTAIRDRLLARVEAAGGTGAADRA
jgi:flavin reductase (DIM6/NTAB) family NADH-FMN oxidoreductase RutF